MEIRELKIEGFKSIGEIVLKSPNPFSVFVGANGAGKSNIFEALELLSYCNVMDFDEATKLFGSIEDITNKNTPGEKKISFDFKIGDNTSHFSLESSTTSNQSNFDRGSVVDFGKHFSEKYSLNDIKETLTRQDYAQFTNFTRLFVGKEVKVKKLDDSSIALDASNLEKVLKRIFQNSELKHEIVETLQLLIPEFENIEIKSDDLSGTDTILVYETGLKKPLTKRLISDGTYNILSILAAIYQSHKPQFLCIEEPENGLNPKVVRELVSIIRNQCEERGHYIWLNTHSQTLVSELRPEEIILVNKVNGMTQTKQVTGMNLHGLRMDEALLTNSLGGGIPW